MRDVVPHSPIWFVIVGRAAPRFGRQVRFNIECEDSHDVCSICGDAPVGDYRIVEAVSTPRGVPSLRLCAACLEARLWDEMLLPMQLKSEGPAAALARAGRAGLAAVWKKIYLPRR